MPRKVLVEEPRQMKNQTEESEVSEKWRHLEVSTRLGIRWCGDKEYLVGHHDIKTYATRYYIL